MPYPEDQPTLGDLEFLRGRLAAMREQIAELQMQNAEQGSRLLELEARQASMVRPGEHLQLLLKHCQLLDELGLLPPPDEEDAYYAGERLIECVNELPEFGFPDQYRDEIKEYFRRRPGAVRKWYPHLLDEWFGDEILEDE